MSFEYSVDHTFMLRKIIHIDADCFYAAIEMRDDPSLRDVPLIVGGSAERRGVVATCNYPARQFGIRSAMATRYARSLCPDVTVIAPSMSKYRVASAAMRDIFLGYTARIEPLSLDEAYLDVTSSDAFFGSATRIAEAIRAQVRDQLGITVSAGVSANKFIAKVASDWRKPDGLMVVEPHEIDDFSAALPVRLIPGVGRVTAEKLARRGLKICADIRATDPTELVRRYGSFGHTLYERSFGRDSRPVNATRIRKSVSVEQTYTQDLESGQPCFEQLPSLLADLTQRVERAGVTSKVAKIFIKVKFADFSGTTVERAGQSLVLRDYEALLAEGLQRKPLAVRLLGMGVRLCDAEPTDAAQLPLLTDSGSQLVGG